MSHSLAVLHLRFHPHLFGASFGRLTNETDEKATSARNHKIVFGIAGALLRAIGCAGGSDGETSAGTVAAADAKAQATQGGTLYGAHP